MALVPADDLPAEVRRSVTPGSPMFNAYAAQMEGQFGLRPGALTGAKYTLQPGTDFIQALERAAMDQSTPEVRGRPVPAEDLPPSAALAAGAPRAGTPVVRPKYVPPEVNPAQGSYPDVGPLGLNLSEGMGNAAAALGRGVVNTAKGVGQFLTSAPTQGAPGVQAESANTQQRLGLTSADVDAARKQDQPLLATPEGMGGAILSEVAQTAIPANKLALGADALRAAQAAGTAPKFIKYIPKGFGSQGAVTGGTFGAVQPVASDESRVGNAAADAGAGFLGGSAMQGLTALARPAIDSASAAKAYLAQQAEKYGIGLRAGQVSDNPFLKAVQGLADMLPFNGNSKLTEAQHKAFNAALAKGMGQDSDSALTALPQARTDLSKTYDALKDKNTLQIEPWHVDAFNDINTGYAPKDITKNKENLASLKAIRRSILDRTDNQGEMSGTAYKELRSQIGDKANTTGDVAYKGALKQYQNILDKQFKAGLKPEDAKLLDLTDRQWGIMRTLEDIAPKDASGDWEFNKLAQRLSQKGISNSKSRSDFLATQKPGTPTEPSMPDLARIGVEFLGRGPEATVSAAAPAKAWAKQVAKSTLGPVGIGGGLYALHHGDEDALTDATLQTLGIMLGGKALGATLNSRAFGQGMPKLATGVDVLRKAGAGQLPVGTLDALRNGVEPDQWAGER